MNLKLTVMLALCASPLLAGDFSLTARPPIIYNVDYDIANRPWDATAQAYAQAPPDLLHLSCVAPYNFRLGPVAAVGNQDVNVRDPDSKLRQRVPPDVVLQRAAMLKEATEKLHKASVGSVMPYICLMTLVGDHEKRLGFWDFYDHWDEYRRIGLYKKPKTDPFTWNQQDLDGKPRYFYPHDIALFRPLYRYATSPAHPDWKRWIAFCVQEAAKTGMDGVFVDNSSACRDFSPVAQQGFHEWIRGRYTEAQRKELLGGMPSMAEDFGTLAAFESHLFWLHAIRQYLQNVRTAGEAIRKPFMVFPNSGHAKEFGIGFSFPDVDYVMFERWGGTLPGRVSASIIGPFRKVRYHDNLFAFAYTFGLGARVRAALLTGERAPYDLYGLNRNATLLSLAEAAAFGGGGIVRTPGPVTDPKLNDAQNLYRSHFRQHRGLYDGKRPLAQAAVACFGSQHYYGHGDHLTVAKSIFDTLLEQHLLTDMLTLDGCFEDNLARYRLIVLPDVRYLSDEHVRALEACRRNGGELLVYGDTGKYDQFMRERKPNPLASLRLAPEIDYESLEAKLAQLKAKAWPAIEPTGLRDAWENGAIKAAAYVDDPARPCQASLHILNYNIDLGRDVNRVARVPAVDVRLPLPQGMKPTSARTIRVEDAKEERLTPSVATGSVSFRVADVGIHTVCVVE